MLTTYLADLPCYGSAFCDILCGIKRTICRHALCSRLPTSLKAAVENHHLRRSGHKRFTDMCEFHTPCYWKCHWKSFEEKEDPPPMYLSQRICDCTDTYSKMMRGISVLCFRSNCKADSESESASVPHFHHGTAALCYDSESESEM